MRDEHAALRSTNQPVWARLASAFHLRVAALAKNAILEQYLTELMSRCSLIVALYESPGNSACEHDERTRIVTLMERRETTAAIRLMNEHLAGLERRISLERAEAPGALTQMLGLA